MLADLRRSPETTVLIDLLRAVPLGGEIGYRALSEAIGRDVRGPARARLDSARRIAQRDHGVAFFCVRGLGLRRITLDELPAVGGLARARIRGTARGALKTMTAVAAVSNGGSPDTLRALSRERASLGLIAHVAAESQQPAFDPGPGAMALPPALAAQSLLKHIGALPPAEGPA